MTMEELQLLEQVKDRMDLHRAVVRGAGFYDWMTKTNDASAWRQVPTINFLDIGNQAYANSIINEALPQDRPRFRRYLRNRPLGISIITGGPGFGKTTVGAAKALLMQAKLGPIFCSAPTSVAVDNFAKHLDERTRAITGRLNAGKTMDDPTRHRRKLVIRPHAYADELSAFWNILYDLQLGDEALDGGDVLVRPSRWKFHLSGVYWLLVLLRSPAVNRRLEPDDSPFLHELQHKMDSHDALWPIRNLATGFDNEYGTIGPDFPNLFLDYFDLLIRGADMLCTTPDASETEWQCRRWKKELARGVAIDEAGGMNRADLYCVWGNTLLPCALFGDTRQLLPIVVTRNDKEGDSGTLRDRFARDGKISALQFFQGTGLPVYRLKTQLRMAVGMFDTAAETFHPDTPFQYMLSRAIGNPEFDIGHALEAFALSRYPELNRSPAGTLTPFFVHCQGSKSFTDITGSAGSPAQSQVALDFLVDLVTNAPIDPAQIAVITPYFANAVVFNEMRTRNRRARQRLNRMQDATTVEGFQGRESDIVVVIMNTTSEDSGGPGLTADKHVLNVMLTRHKCGLAIFGDICASGSVKMGPNGNLARGNTQRYLQYHGLHGEARNTKAVELCGIDTRFLVDGRIATVHVDE
ncbi:hypothetical protein NW762_009160 [Fusarium torreyae]|uniref:DNA2/NAM7 helicase-like C-terminal domain-containing protein n=1 Tax=Fusarium torreyae TaxID=1237075 RepID=A0A9W8VES5_9HYPO|nr:hypothetical protein NW762_009160 [Fusarium torreyae]